MTDNPRYAWRALLDLYLRPQPITLFFLGFSSGLPLLLVFGSLSVWLREAGIDRSTIGFVSWVALAYGIKWVWSPLVDRLPIPILSRWLGRRRSWMLVSQLAVISGLVGMALTDPSEKLEQLIWFAVLVAFASATQDIVIDAFRIEEGGVQLQKAMATTYMVGYRIAMIVAGAGVLWLAAWVDIDETTYQHLSWQFAYFVMAGLMSIGVLTTLAIGEPHPLKPRPIEATQEPRWLTRLPSRLLPLMRWMWSAVLSPFIDFFARHRWLALLILALIATYRVSDIVLGVVANVFYIDMGFTKEEIANVAKVFGVVMTIVGTLSYGLFATRFSVIRLLFFGALLGAATNLLFALLAGMGASLPMLVLVIAMDNLSGGFAVAAFVAYLSALTNVQFSATQYALFSSVMLLLPKFFGGFSGVIVDTYGYAEFFVFTALIGVPVLGLVLLVGHYTPIKESGENG